MISLGLLQRAEKSGICSGSKASEKVGGNDREFVALIDRLSGMSSFDEAEQCIDNVVADRDADVVAEFKSIVSTFFNGYHL